MFEEIVSSCVTFDDFYKRLRVLNNELKGCFFEKFAKEYFVYLKGDCSRSQQLFKQPVKSYYMLKDMPKSLLRKFDLPDDDIGVDAFLELEDGEWLTVQVKFKTNVHQPTPYKELATWMATTFLLAPKGISRGILFTNAEDTTDRLKYATNIIKVTGATLKHSITNDFFQQINTNKLTVSATTLQSNDLDKFRFNKPGCRFPVGGGSGRGYSSSSSTG